MNLTPKQLEALKTVMENGRDKYWKDKDKERIEYQKWIESNLQGDGPDTVKGSLIDYINEEVLKEIESW